jgi:radical SAM protein with 4Fe4S-binding SPASM domain
MADSIILFKNLAKSNAFRKLFLNPFIKDCKKDGNIIDVVIERYIDPDFEVCSKCKIKSNIANKLLDKLAGGFNLSPEYFKDLLKTPFFKSTVKTVIRGIKQFGFQKPFLPAAPFLVIWDFTSLCNSRCKHCYQNAGEKSDDELNFEQQKKVIDILSEWGVVFLAFSGGEPLVHPDFFKLAEYTTKKGLVLAIVTNGTLITKKVAKKLADVKVAYAEVSLDSLDSKEHDEFRRFEGGWEKTVKGIENLVKEGISTCMITFIHKNNYKKIPEFVSFAKKLGATFWANAEYKPVGRALNLDIDMSPEEREEALKILSDITINEWRNKRENKPFIIIDTSSPQFGRKMTELSKIGDKAWGHYGFLINNSIFLEIIGGCAAGRAFIALQKNGDITPCIYMPDLVVGNILKDDLRDLWINNQIFKNVRNRDDLEGYCPKCEYEYICGGCRARAYGYFKDPIKPDIGCIYNKNYYKKNNKILE